MNVLNRMKTTFKHAVYYYSPGSHRTNLYNIYRSTRYCYATRRKRSKLKFFFQIFENFISFILFAVYE